MEKQTNQKPVFTCHHRGNDLCSYINSLSYSLSHTRAQHHQYCLTPGAHLTQGRGQETSCMTEVCFEITWYGKPHRYGAISP